MEKPKLILRGLIRAIRDEPRIFGLLLLCLTGFFLLAGIADEVREGEHLPIDRQILLMMRNPHDTSKPIGGAWLGEVMRDITGLGGIFFLTFITLACFFYLLAERRKAEAVYMIASIGTGVAFNCLLKGFFNRPRPDLFPHGAIIYTSSFPSGHSMMSATVYLTLGALLAEAHARRGLKAYFVCLGVLLTLMIGVSRLYLAVHWPTDVMAGWLGGAAWAIMVWLIRAKVLRHMSSRKKSAGT